MYFLVSLSYLKLHSMVSNIHGKLNSHCSVFSLEERRERKRIFLHHRWHHCQEFNFCKIFPLGERIFFCFLLITMNSTCERPSSHFSRDGLDGRPSSLARVKLKQRIMDVHIFPQDSKWKKILKYPFIDVPSSSSLQFLPPTSFNCRDWPRSSAGNPISKKRDRILWSLFHIPELGSGEEATSSDHIKPCTLWRKGGGVGKLIFISFRSHWQHGSSEMRS